MTVAALELQTSFASAVGHCLDAAVVTIARPVKNDLLDTEFLGLTGNQLADFLRRAADPWMLDLDGIAQKIAEGCFNAYDIDPLPGRDVTVRPGAGEWFLESPFCPVMTVQADGTLTLLNLALGMHGLFSMNGQMNRIDVSPAGTVVMAMP